MISGRLRDKINIEQQSVTLTESGQEVPTWTDFLTDVFAEIKTPTGREYFGHDKLNASAKQIVRMRWHDGILPEMRVKWGTRTLNIEYISEDRTHAHELWLYCKEDRDNG